MILSATTACSLPPPHAQNVALVHAPQDVSPRPSRDVAIDSTEAEASLAADAQVTAVHPQTVTPITLSHVAALDSDHMLAIGGEQLLTVRDGRWVPLRLDGAIARDVRASAGALWVLAEGTGPNVGRALVLQSRDANGLSLWRAISPSLADRRPDHPWRPQVLAVRSPGPTVWVGGVYPSLLRVDPQGTVHTEQDSDAVSYLYLESSADESVVGARVDGDFDVYRYGQRNTIVRANILQFILDRADNGHVLLVDGVLRRGRPGRAPRRMVGPAPIEPRTGVITLTGHAMIIAAGGPLATEIRGSWQVTPGDWPNEPLAITQTDPPMVVARDGQVLVVEGAGRTVVQPLVAH